MIQVFNRSYYEDILVPWVNKTITETELDHRVKMINLLETHLKRNGTHILKFFLNISRDEQQERIAERLTEPHKMWKFAKEDVKAADRWREFGKVNNMMLRKCQVTQWHINPSDKRWYRNYLVAKALVDHFDSLGLHYPKL